MHITFCAPTGECVLVMSRLWLLVVPFKWESCGVEQMVRVVRASCDLDFDTGMSYTHLFLGSG